MRKMGNVAYQTIEQTKRRKLLFSSQLKAIREQSLHDLSGPKATVDSYPTGLLCFALPGPTIV